MKAAYLKAPFQFDVREVSLRPLLDDEVLVQVKACSVCGHDMIMASSGAVDWQPFGHEIAGVVERIGSRVRNVAPGDRVVLESGTFDRYSDLSRNGRVDLDNKGGGASAGMFASGEIEVSRGKVLTLPQSAVLLRDGFSYVFRVGPDNRVIQTKVSVGQRSGDLIAIIGGLESGIAVASNGVGFLADGDLVRVLAAPVR